MLSLDPNARADRRGAGCKIQRWLPLAFALALVLAAGCRASHHPTQPAVLGQPAGAGGPGAEARLLAGAGSAGPIEFEKVHAADWVVPLSGLVDLSHPAARAAGLEDRDEPIDIYFYALRHPAKGLFLVDSGVEAGFREEGGNPRVSALVAAGMKTDALEVHTTTGEWLARAGSDVAGVFVTHLHLDHVMGLPDLPSDVPVYVGPGETEASGFLNLVTRGTIDRMLQGAGPLEEWQFSEPGASRFDGVLDVFGDGSLFAIHVPGHTPGSMAFLARTTSGPQLMIGDTSHTRWGWENGVPPGSYTADHAANASNLERLRALVTEYPSIEVHLGHQPLVGPND